MATPGARAEPYLALRSEQRCAACHVNQTGGGMRTPFGNAYAQTQLAARFLEATSAWNGQIGDGPLAIGANLRAAARRTQVGGQRSSEALDWREARAFLAFAPIAERLTFYVDQYLGPGASLNREAFVLYRAVDAGHYLKAGRIYLPFGWRLQDNSAFVRSETAIDMIGPDRGIELGWDPGPWSLQLAVSNGTYGQREVDDGKQVSLQAVYLQPGWRLGAALNINKRDLGDRHAAGLFAGARTGPVVWLVEFDAVEDRATASAARRSFAWLTEANWLAAAGHNLKLSLEGLDPDRRRRADRQTRLSLVYEFTPLPFVQLRAGARRYEGPSHLAPLNRRLYFVELHAFF